MLVSIITPTHNSIEFIDETYQSILAQTLDNWEWVVTDDASTDGTYEWLLEKAQMDIRIRVYRNSCNSGAGATRNRSILESKGRFIAFLDADDLWLPNKLKTQITFMCKNNVLLSYTSYQKFDVTGDGGIVIPPSSVTYKELLHSNVIGCLTAIYDTKYLGKRYMPLIRKRQDMGLWLDILKNIKHAKGMNTCLAKYRTDSGMTSNKLTVLKYQWDFYRTVVGLSLPQTILNFALYAYKGYIKQKI
ncbi:glycosyltransferase family 2 protein [Vibrio breoganii]|uniref:glycosyltransferase family 2 protein n=1 Tax=Vibrio breoganii TaxID=553239 RepID=UPI000C84EBD2|nr:glycosyltransferase family 2 protein [Vibrio breoganii]